MVFNFVKLSLVLVLLLVDKKHQMFIGDISFHEKNPE